MCILVKVGLTVEARERHVLFKGLSPGLSLFLGEQLPTFRQMVVLLERFELSFNGRSKTEIVRHEIIDQAELLALHLGLLTDVVTFRVPPQGRTRKKSLGD